MVLVIVKGRNGEHEVIVPASGLARFRQRVDGSGEMIVSETETDPGEIARAEALEELVALMPKLRRLVDRA